MRFIRLALPALAIALVTHGARAQPVESPSSARELAESLTDRSDRFTPTDVAGAEAALRESMAKESTEAIWPLALGILAMREGNAAGARPLFERAAELAPDNADALAWLANALFSTINDAGLLEKGRMASRARDLLARALEIDPTHVSARISLIEFYRQAPGIAGGSTKKAREHAEALVGQPGGATHGHRLLAQIAIEDEDWAEADRQFALAIEAAGDDADERHQVMLARGYTILNDKKDPVGALPILREAFEAQGGTDGNDTTTIFLYARALAETGDCAGAIPLFERVLANNPGAMNSRFLLADCLAKRGVAAEAIAQYEEFLTRFPKGDLAGKAKKALKALQRSQR